MELSMQETDTRFDEAIEAAARGESVVLTKHGRPVAKLVATQTDRKSTRLNSSH